MGAYRGICILAAATMMVSAAPPARADDGFSGCESVPLLGLNPKIRKICDGPFYADGSWPRYRQFVTSTFTHSSCGGIYWPGGGCPSGMAYDTIPAQFGPVETYVLTAETIPPGEPGHLDNPVRCREMTFRCD